MNSNLMTSSLSNKKCVVPNLAEENFESDWVFLTEHSALMKAFSAGKEKKNTANKRESVRSNFSLHKLDA